MSLTTALRPVGLPFGAGAKRETHTSTSENTPNRPFQHEVNYLNLHRTLIRFQHLILLTPSPASSATGSELTPLQKEIQAELWSPWPYHRNKWLRNVEGARTLLLHLERKAQRIQTQRAKYEAVKDLAEKRAAIKRLRNRIEEIGREVETTGVDNWFPSAREEDGETLYDLLQQQARPRDGGGLGEESEKHHDLKEGKPVTTVEGEEDDAAGRDEKSERDQRGELFGTSNLRRRGKGLPDDTGDQTAAKTSGFSHIQSTERALLDSSRVQEDITTSLVDMATRLKQQGRALQFTLDQDKGILGRAIQGLDLNLSGMEAASKNMAFLRRMSEEEGWLGRLKLYALIFGMWVVAFLLVFVSPKLRF